jgi:hypothetical protein
MSFHCVEEMRCPEGPLHPSLQRALDRDIAELRQLQRQTEDRDSLLALRGASDGERAAGTALLMESCLMSDCPFSVLWLEQDTALFDIDGVRWLAPRVMLAITSRPRDDAPGTEGYLGGLPLELELTYLPLTDLSCSVSPVLGPTSQPEVLPATPVVRLPPPTAIPSKNFSNSEEEEEEEEEHRNSAAAPIKNQEFTSSSIVPTTGELPPSYTELPSPMNQTTTGRVLPVIRVRVTSTVFHCMVDEDTGLLRQDEVQHALEREHKECDQIFAAPSPFALHTAVSVVHAAVWALSQPRKLSLRAEAVPAEDDLLHFWQHRDNWRSSEAEAAAALLPASWEQFEAAGDGGGDQPSTSQMCSRAKTSVSEAGRTVSALQRELLKKFIANIIASQTEQAEQEMNFLRKRQDAFLQALRVYSPKTAMLFTPRRLQPDGLREAACYVLQDDYGETVEVGSGRKRQRSPDALRLPSTLQRPCAFSGIVEGELLNFMRDHDIATHCGAHILRTSFCREDAPHVFSFPFLTETFCEILAAEVKQYEATPGLPKFRPNSMNRYGLILNEIGLKPFVDELCRVFIFPIASCLFPEQLLGVDTLASSSSPSAAGCHGDNEADGGAPRYSRCFLDHHHTFVVEYRTGGDVALDMHSDDSEVTLNVNLSSNFEGSSLCFCGMPETARHRKHSRSYSHQKGRAVVHPGALRHGALPLTSGERMNMIVWARSTWLRQHQQSQRGSRRYAFASDEEEPDRICMSRTHDPDFDVKFPS